MSVKSRLKVSSPTARSSTLQPAPLQLARQCRCPSFAVFVQSECDPPSDSHLPVRPCAAPTDHADPTAAITGTGCDCPSRNGNESSGTPGNSMVGSSDPTSIGGPSKGGASPDGPSPD